MTKILILLSTTALFWSCSSNTQAPKATETVEKPSSKRANKTTAPTLKPPTIVPKEKGADAELSHVLSGDESYYLDGPQQARPPDGVFKSGTRVRLIRKDGSYSVVETASGLTAYVSTGALQPL